jgi:hypothetical protein
MKNQRKEPATPNRSIVATGEYMRPPEAARYVGHSESTLAKLRMRHMRERGPAFIKRGGVVLYRRTDLDAWLDSYSVR